MSRCTALFPRNMLVALGLASSLAATAQDGSPADTSDTFLQDGYRFKKEMRDLVRYMRFEPFGTPEPGEHHIQGTDSLGQKRIVMVSEDEIYDLNDMDVYLLKTKHAAMEGVTRTGIEICCTCPEPARLFQEQVMELEIFNPDCPDHGTRTIRVKRADLAGELEDIRTGREAPPPCILP